MDDFSYLGQTIIYNNIDWAAGYQNLCKANRQWRMVARAQKRTIATLQAWGAMYKAMAQSVLLYSRESWVVTGEMLKVLTGFHHQAERRITGMTEKHGGGGEWE